MKYIILILAIPMLVLSCAEDTPQNKIKENALKLKEKELSLKERQLELRENAVTDQKMSAVSAKQEISFKSHNPCTFSVKLPSHFSVEAMFAGTSPDYCDHSVKTKDGFEIIELHSMLNSRFDLITIGDLYKRAVEKSELDITYKMQKGNWFVISGTEPKTGNLVYWKRVAGENFISDLHIEYPEHRGEEIEPHIGTIASSFTSE